MLDFTSVLYLGFRHGSRSVRPWSQLTTGAPTALIEPTVALDVGSRLAQLQGCERATVGSSTLHLFWDLFAQLGKRPFAIFLDAGAYPIAQWGVERAEMRGVPIYRFPHHNVGAVAHLIRRMGRTHRPLIVSDGLCSSCGCTAPIADYMKIVRAHQGVLVLDDTQALGLLGFSADGVAPYGRLGGGTLQHQAIFGPELIVVSSLAKSFGVPLAVLCGSRKAVRTFQNQSETRIHCSPPSLPTLHAAERALTLNEQQGDRRRHQLAQNVLLFRRHLAEEGIFTNGGLFPVQTLRLPSSINRVRLYKTLRANHVRSVLRKGCNGRSAISFVITARHRPDDIKQAIEKLTSAIDSTRFHHSHRQSLF